MEEDRDKKSVCEGERYALETFGLIKLRELLNDGNGRYFEAVDRTGKKHFVKVRKAVDDEFLREYYEREVELTKTLKHKNIVESFNAVFLPGYCIVDSECCDTDLEIFEKFNYSGALPEPVLQAVTKDVAAGISYLHEKGIAHCDIKPRNILLQFNPDGSFTSKIGDFFFSQRDAGDGLSMVQGTPFFMAPEVANGEKYTKKCDLWSLGVMLFKLATGKSPFSNAKTRTEIAKQPPVFDDLDAAEVSDACKDLIRKLLVRDPAARLSITDVISHPFLSPELRMEDRPEREVRSRREERPPQSDIYKEEERYAMRTFGLTKLRDFKPGSFGHHFLAVDRTGKKHFVKVRKPLGARDAFVKEYYEREVEISKALKHKNVVETFDAVVVRNSSVIDAEHCDTDLESFVMFNHAGVLPEPILKSVAKDVAAGISYLHEKGIAHCDIKPEHVFLKFNPDGSFTTKIGGFVLSQFDREGIDTVQGTPNYKAPEVKSGVKYTKQCDLWSLGVTLYKVATGRFPFSSPSKIAEESPNFDILDAAEVSDACKDFIKKLLVKDPAARMSINDVLSHPFLQ